MADVVAFSKNNAWAVGSSGTILHWNGTTWSGITDFVDGDLYGIWGATPNDVWAVGGRDCSKPILCYEGCPPGWPTCSDPRDTAYSILLHWDGKAWSWVKPPGKRRLTHVWGTGRNDVWALGGNFPIHWNGSSWIETKTDSVETLNDIWGPAANDVWAVGNSGTVEHWNGQRWAEVDVETRKNLLQVVGSGRSDVWIVAAQSDALLHWDGQRFQEVKVQLKQPTISKLWLVAQDDLWVLGFDESAHWNGKDWTQGGPVARGAMSNVARLNRTTAMTVGGAGLILWWDGSHWSVPVESVRARLDAIRGSDKANLWAVGYGTVVRRTGGRWSSALNESVGFNSVWPWSDHDVWFAGDVLNVAKPGPKGLETVPTPRQGIWHWNGERFEGIASMSVRALWGSSPKDMWAAQDKKLLHWDGSSWSPTEAGTKEHITGLWGSSTADLWASTFNGVFHVGPGPAKPTGEGWYLYTVQGSGPSDVWGLGNEWAIHWDGKEWKRVEHGYSKGLNGLYVERADSAWAVGYGGAIFHWDGSQWKRQSSGTNTWLRNVWGYGGEVWACGDDGAVLHHGP